jgi:hypothetical protein
MSNDTTISIGISVKDGAKIQTQSFTNKNVSSARNEGVRSTTTPFVGGKDCIILNSAGKPCPAAESKGYYSCDPSELAIDSTQVLFLALAADKYTYKDSCGKDEKGIQFAYRSSDFPPKGVDPKSHVPSECWSEWFWLESPINYVAQPGQPLSITNLRFRVHELMVDRVKRDPPPIQITVTYGIGKTVAPVCTPLAAAKMEVQNVATRVLAEQY